MKPNKNNLYYQQIVIRNNSGRNGMLLFVTTTLLFFLFFSSFTFLKFISWYSDGHNFHNYLDGKLTDPMIFIGGFPRSGLTLMRVLIDSHPMIHCGPDTDIISDILNIYSTSVKKDQRRLKAAGLFGKPFDSAIAAFILEVLKHQRINEKQAICSKDFSYLTYSPLLASSFSNSKFIFMIRDGRAVVNSIVTHADAAFLKEIENGKDSWEILEIWEKLNLLMIENCLSLKSRCLIVKYETLVLKPQQTMEDVFKFLNVNWHNNVMRHSEIIQNDKKITLNEMERTFDEVTKPIYLSSLKNWTENQDFAQDFIKNAHKIVHLISLLGYNVDSIPPDYNKTQQILNEKALYKYIKEKKKSTKEKYL